MKIIPIFFYHEKWAVIIRKFVYSPDGVEKMGPLRGDGNSLFLRFVIRVSSREDGSPSRGRKQNATFSSNVVPVEEMGPLRGDGNKRPLSASTFSYS